MCVLKVYFASNNMNSLRKYELLKKKYKKINKSCEICSNTQKQKIQSIGRVARPGDYGELKIYICKNCGYKFQNPSYPDKFFKEYYEILYRQVAFDGKEPSTIYLSEQKKRGYGVFNWINKLEKVNFKRKVLLDHGCASGVTMDCWKKAKWKTFGVDPHVPSVKLARKLGYDVNVGLGEKLPFPDKSFSLVISLGSLEHSYNLNRSLKEIRRVLDNDGYLFVRWRSDKIFGSPLEYYNHNHYRFFTNKTWRLVLKKYGFNILSKTKDRLEGWDSYEYFIAKKKKIDIPDFSKINFDYKKEIALLKKIRKKYYFNSKKFIDLYNNYKDCEDFFSRLQNTTLKNNWGFLGSKPKEKIKRSLMEAKLYIKKYESGEVY